MFHSLFDYEDQNADFNRIDRKSNINRMKNQNKMEGPSDNYFGKGNKAIDNYNRKRVEMENDNKFKRTKNKIKLVVYKNGFILNNGPFRERCFQENSEFLDSVEKGNIPQELIKKGINDLGILLINRRKEIYRSPLYQSMPISFNYNNISQNSDQLESSEHVLDQFFRKQVNKENNDNVRPPNKIYSTYVPQTPIGFRNERNNIFYRRNTISRVKKPKEKAIIYLADILKGDIEEKKYIPFSGSGKLLGISHIEEFCEEEEEVNFLFDNFSPCCRISIRIFDGKIVKGKFNYFQTLRDIYLYAKKASGLNDFILLDGFPPKPLTQFEKTIEELRLENSVLTQKLI